MKSLINSFHYRPLHPIWWLLLPLEWAYGLACLLRLWLYRSEWLKTQQVETPVISIGNLTTGGTGKTPVVAELTRRLAEKGLKIVILSRGYGARRPQTYSRATNPDWGDEAYWLQQEIPQAIVIVGKDRAETARRAISEFQPDVILLDDGFQHLRLERTTNILLVDGTRGFGNGHLLPLGPLREPAGQVNRATSIWVTKTDAIGMPAWLKKYLKKDIPVHTIPFESSGFRNWDTGKIAAEPPENDFICLSGIADPHSFENLLPDPIERFRFADHHVYSPGDVKAVVTHLEKGTCLITTSKDEVKLRTVLPEKLWPLVYTLEVRPALNDKVLQDLNLQELRHGLPVHS